ncbi:hypothetical protein HK099_000984 [Clydaea vesicula]|uniref:Uncharacterized protein n=1 Tax=Clydaea vesicula TaxID=447962 RepID=A0AAD5TWS3_9FUNG|nr:hypothetical protein HK099_000984 [Clydaea vesicula]
MNDYRNCICGNVATAEICATNPSFTSDLHTCAMVSNSPTNILWSHQHSGKMSTSCSTGELNWFQQKSLPSWKDEPSSPSPPPVNNPPANNPPSSNNPPANNPPSNNNTPANNPQSNNNSPTNNPVSSNNPPANNPPSNNNLPANNPPSNNSPANNSPTFNSPTNNINNPVDNNSTKPGTTTNTGGDNSINNSDNSDTSSVLLNNPPQLTTTLTADNGIVSNTYSNLSIGLILGIVFGIVAFIGLIILLFCLIRNTGKYPKNYNTPYENSATYQNSNNQNYNYRNNNFVNTTNNEQNNNDLTHGNFDHSANGGQSYGNSGHVTQRTASYSSNSAPNVLSTPQVPSMTYQDSYSSASVMNSRNSVLPSVPYAPPSYSSLIPLNPDSDIKVSSKRINAFDMDDEALKKNFSPRT